MKTTTRLLRLSLVGQFIGGMLVAWAVAAPKAPEPATWTVDAMAAPVPALKYTLVPEPIDQVPGNAAIAYQRVLRLLSQSDKWSEHREKCREWLELPLESFPEQDAESVLGPRASVLGELAKAARYEQCDWQTPIRQEGFSALLPHLSEARDAARLLALEIRLRVRQGRYEEATGGLRTGFTLAQHLGEGSTLIEGLVGLAVARMMTDRAEELIQQPRAPNLYWAFVDLPPAYLDAWRAMRWERSAAYLHFPALWEARTRPITAADLHRSVKELHKITGDRVPMEGLAGDEQAALVAVSFSLIAYPRATEMLVEQGHSPEAIRAMSVANALATYFGGCYAVQRDNLFKWFALPFSEARHGLAQAEADFTAAVEQDPVGNMLAGLLLPAVGRAAQRFAEFERERAVIRGVEAIRMYAAAHGGRPPDRLADIREAPVPLDPMTGLAFGYQRDGQTARLEVPGEAELSPRSPRVYVITIRP